MLDGLKALIDSLGSLDTKSEVVGIIDGNTERITQLQLEQTAEGYDNTGKPRADEYRPLTVHLKNTLPGISSLGRITDHVTFFMHGNLYGTMHTVTTGETFETISPLFTYDKMIKRIGPEYWGLDAEQKVTYIIEITIPEFVRILEEKTGLKL